MTHFHKQVSISASVDRELDRKINEIESDGWTLFSLTFVRYGSVRVNGNPPMSYVAVFRRPKE